MNPHVFLGAIALVAMLVGGCYRSHGLDAGDLSDGDLPDSRVRDSGSGDGARPDGAPVDSGHRDSGFLDSGRPDTGAPDAGLPDGGVLTRCATDSDCSGACVRAPGVAAVDLARLDLACGPATAASSDGALCDTNADCGRGLCVVAGSCVAPCVVDGDCGPRQRCTELWVRTSSSALQWLNGCVDRVNAPPDVHVSRGRAGVVRGADTPDTLSLAHAPGTQVMVLEPELPQTLYASRFRTSETPAVMLFDAEGYAGDGPPPLAPFGTPGPVLSILMPNGPRARRSPAGYGLDLYSDSRTPVFVTSMSRERIGHTLDLDLFYVGARGLAPSGDRGPARIADALATVERVCARFGVRLGVVRQHEIVGQLQRDFAVIEGTSDGSLPEMPELLRLSAGAGRSSVSLFLVREVSLALGVAGGIPGPESIHGTGSSGILIAVDLHDPTADDLGYTMAHEIGHFLGLWHTTEYDGSIYEPLPDTLRCPRSLDADGDGYVMPEECAANDGYNLMFWAGVGETLSPQQSDLLAHAPLLY